MLSLDPRFLPVVFQGFFFPAIVAIGPPLPPSFGLELLELLCDDDTNPFNLHRETKQNAISGDADHKGEC